MFIGHYSVSLAFKKADVSIPLWKLFFAVQFLDILWSIFIFLGIEKAEIDLHTLPASPLNLYYMPFTHSILGALFWSLVVFVITIGVSKLKNTNLWKRATIFSVAVFSHWVLDFIVHSSDLPIWGNSYKVGIGLYQSAIGTFVVECTLLILGALIYHKVIQNQYHRSKKFFIAFILFLLFLCGNSIWGIKPPTTNIAAGYLLTLYFLNALIIYFVEKNFVKSINVSNKNSIEIE